MDTRSRCDEHGLAAGPDGRCVVCRRAQAAGGGATSGPWVIGALAALVLLAGGAALARGLRGAAPAGAQPTEVADVHEASVRLYTTSWCPHCARAKAWLKENQVAYVELDVEEDAAARRDQRRLNPSGGVPTLYADGEVVVGFSPEQFEAALHLDRPHDAP